MAFKDVPQPPRTFEHYTLTRFIGPGSGLTRIPDSAFKSMNGDTVITSGFGGETGSISRGYSDEGISYLTPIGFNFEFDGVTYRNFVASTDGMFALADPSKTSPTSVLHGLIRPGFGGASGAPFTSEGARDIITSSVLLGPWWDDLRNVASGIEQVTTESISDNNKIREQFGFNLRSSDYNETANATKVFYDVRSPQGRRTIIRWNSISNIGIDPVTLLPSSGSSILKFEAVLYENGTIEFRYAPKQALSFNTKAFESASIGIWTSGTNRFRDFSYGLGYRDQERNQYKYGGARYEENTSYLDVGEFLTCSYTVKLNPLQHWPGGSDVGAIFKFEPPKNRRQVLPRKQIHIHDSRPTLPINSKLNQSIGTDQQAFDDRRSINYVSGVIVNYPTTLTRFIGDTEGNVSLRQNLFIGSDKDFLVTGSIVKSAIEQFIVNEKTDSNTIEPYNEQVSTCDYSSGTHDPFFTSGTMDIGEQSSQPIWSKSQIKLTLPVEYNTSFLQTTASILYYNKRTKSWQVPFNSISTTNSDFSTAYKYAQNGNVAEDYIGFNCIGNLLASGSNLIVSGTPANARGSDHMINSPFTHENLSIALSKNYAKTITVNPSYHATADETFTIPITQPFIIEKAVFKIPFKMGQNWFNMVTLPWKPYYPSPAMTFNNLTGQGLFSSGFDLTGPGITVALFNQLGNSNTQLHRDLILTGVITHVTDSRSGVHSKTLASASSGFITNRGYYAFANPPAAIVTPRPQIDTLFYQFTGSVTVKTEAAVSHGAVLEFYESITDTMGSRAADPWIPGEVTSSVREYNKLQAIKLINSEFLTLNSGTVMGTQFIVSSAYKYLLTGSPLFAPTTSTYLDNGIYSYGLNIAYISPFGRRGNGFGSSGRSIFGREYSTNQGLIFPGNRIRNPFYLTGSAFTTLSSSIVGSVSSNVSYVAFTAINLASHFRSPYLLLPGDKLVLAVSHGRPPLFKALVSGSLPSSTYEDERDEFDSEYINFDLGVISNRLSSNRFDVSLITGSISVTLYGTQLSDGKEFHDTLTQNLSSDVIHEDIHG